ncbi:MAG: hypothetical protein H6Q25_410 [Bacteroidetes bacterium]|nr:hypothetical protein [Bacteroidota bacterium]
MRPKLVFLIIIQILIVFPGRGNNYTSSPEFPLVPIDTINLDFSVSMSKSIFVPEYYTQVNYYFTEINEQLYFIYSIDSIKPTTIFKLQGLLTSFYCLNKDSLIVNYPNSDQYLLINNKSEIIDTFYFDFSKIYGEKKIPWTFLNLFSNKNKNGEYFLYFQTTIPSLHNYQRSLDSRIKLFSEPILSCYKFSGNCIKIEKGIGKYPDKFKSLDGMYNYIYHVSLNRNLDFIFSFYELDSLSIYSNGEMKSKYLNSKFKTKEIKYKKNIDDYDLTEYEENSSKTVGYLNHYYDSYRDQYYIIVKKQYPYENEDGTYNKPEDAPWSILILNDKFEKVDEIDMPNHLRKQGFFIVPEGIAIQDKILTDQNSGNSVLVLYKIKNYNL